jgi:glycosyltransferase involved in cell wall biosynthesis
MRVAILGTRGVPANYGGFETFAEQLGRRLVQRGHEVTVYGRDLFVPRKTKTYLGMRIVRLPAPQSKYFETVIHTLFATFHVLTQHYDIVYVCNSANVPAVILLRLFGQRVVLNVDGLEWKRRKWSGIGRAYYRVCAWTAARLPVHVVTDALVIQRYYKEAYGRHTDYFPYGTELEPVADDGTLARLGLEAGHYVLYVSRLEPENNAHVVIKAYASVKTDLPLAVVGDAPYASEYIASLRATGDRKWAGLTRHSSRPWALATQSSPTTCPSIARRSVTLASTTEGPPNSRPSSSLSSTTRQWLPICGHVPMTEPGDCTAGTPSPIRTSAG